MKLPPILANIQNLILSPVAFQLSNYFPEKESTAYAACRFTIGSLNVVFRCAKITPTKTGQFVTIWKRSETGPIAPFDVSDAVDLLVIYVENENLSGLFVFPKWELLNQKIFSNNNKNGKRGIRVYPPWDQNLNRQAQKTQHWQLQYFIEIPAENFPDPERVKSLFTMNLPR